MSVVVLALVGFSLVFWAKEGTEPRLTLRMYIAVDCRNLENVMCLDIS
jgi:hypothetical protein